MIIFQSNNTEYKILIPNKPTQCMRYASEELKKYIFKASGIRMEVVREPQEAGKYISIGETEMYKNSGLNVDFSTFNQDGFVIKSEKDTIYIVGARERATLYGVYDFLEKFLGIRFVTTDCTHIPKMEELVLDNVDIKEIPAFFMRSYWTTDTQKDYAFAARKRAVAVWNNASQKYGGSMYDDYQNDGHNVLKLTKAGENFHKNPECFALIKNKRKALDICWTNGVTDDGKLDETKEVSTAKLLIQSIKERILKNPSITYHAIKQEDSRHNICRCPRCKAVWEKYGKKDSAQIIRMLNVVADEIQKWSDENMGGKTYKIVTVAYFYSEVPPVERDKNGGFYTIDDQVRPHKNLYFELASCFDLNKVYPIDDVRQSDKWKFILGGWTYLTKNIFLYEYTTNFNNYFWYHPNLYTLKKNIKYMLENYNNIFITYEGGESIPKLWQAELRTYVYQTLMWNPDLDEKDLIEEYLSLYYGKYAYAVKHLIQTMEDHLSVLRKEQGGRLVMWTADHLKKHYLNYENWPLEMLLDQIKVLETARKEALKDDTLTRKEQKTMYNRLTKVLCTPKMMLFYNYNEYANYYQQIGQSGSEIWVGLQDKNRFLADFFKDMEKVQELGYVVHVLSIR